MLEVHPPHTRIHGVRDFFFHILAITVGLLIAVGIEGLVEWRHHRHLVHEAEASLYGEIKANAGALKDTLDELHKEQGIMLHDVEVLKQIAATGKMPEGEHLDVSLHIRGFDDVAWRTAQATGAAGYMSYDEAQRYANIYITQDRLTVAEDQAARDAIESMAPMLNFRDNKASAPTSVEAQAIRDKIGVLEGQLLLVDSLMQTLDGQYKQFLSSNSDD